MDTTQSLNPKRVRHSSNQCLSDMSSIIPEQCDVQFSNTYDTCVGLVQNSPPTDLVNCINNIVKKNCSCNDMINKIRCTLAALSAKATPDQIYDLLDGYATLYDLCFFVFPVDLNANSIGEQFRIFNRPSHTNEQKNRPRKCAFIEYDAKQSLFKLWHVSREVDRPQTLFCEDNNGSNDHRQHSILNSNDGKHQTSTRERISTSTRDEISHTENNLIPNATDNLAMSLGSDPINQPNIHLTGHQLRENESVQPDPHFDTEQSKPSSENSLFETAQNHNLSSFQVEDEPVIEPLNLVLKHVPMEVDPIDREEIEQAEIIEKRKSTTHLSLKSRLASSNGNHDLHKTPIPTDDLLSLSTLNSITREATLTNMQEMNNPFFNYAPLTILKQPKRHRRARRISELVKGTCSLVQAGNGNQQRCYPEVEVPKYDGHQLYCRVRAVTDNEQHHLLKSVVPANTRVDWNSAIPGDERSCLHFDDNNFDRSLECVYLPISPKERISGRTTVKVGLINWKQSRIDTKERIDQEYLKLCKLEFCLSMQTSPGVYQVVSPPSYSSIIEESDGDVTIDLGVPVQPQQLCERGGEMIVVPLNVLCRKQGFRIECNGVELKSQQFQVIRKRLGFLSPPMEPGNRLPVKILRTEYANGTAERHEKVLYDGHLLEYRSHGECEHKHC